MAHFKRKSNRSSTSKKCSICCGQRRHFGDTIRQREEKKIATRELREQLV